LSKNLFRAVVLVICVGTIASMGFGQDCRISTILRVLGKRGQPVANVTATEVKATINGAQANVSSISPAAKPAIVLMLDASGSMRSSWNESIAAARALLSNAGEDVAILVFGDKIQDRAVGRANSQKLLDRWSREVPRRGTALYDALIETARRGGPGNAAIVIISEGDDDESTHSGEETKSLFLRSSWPPVFGLVVDYVHGGPEHRRNGLRKISGSTGGFVSYPLSASKVPEALENLEAAVLNPFTVTLQPSQTITASAKLKLEIHDFHTFYTAEVAGCDSPSSARTSQR
jgi:VWA domain containing CoxE-like protein